MGVEWIWRWIGSVPVSGDGGRIGPELEEAIAATDALARSDPGERQERHDPVAAVLATKLLGAHLANRHQISFPLTLDFRSLTDDEAALMMDVAGCAILADGQANPATLRQGEERLARLGASGSQLARLKRAVDDPRPFEEIVARVRAADRAPYAYAVSSLTAGSRATVGHLYLNYLAARLGLTAATVAGINRRFRA